jgi:hypothetical protein
MKMAHEYRQATALVSIEPSAARPFGGHYDRIDMLRGPHRHVANEVIRDLTISILIGFAAIVAVGLLTRMWDLL